MQTPRDELRELIHKSKTYIQVIFRAGPNYVRNSSESHRLEMESIQYFLELRKQGVVCIAGKTISEGSDIAGTMILNVESKIKAAEVITKDPMVKQGHRTVEFLEWLSVAGDSLF